ncbi:MAG: hypothetical protein FWD58_02145 [Firmicutes bacterium]|nr:hypothetical protein [Bacillota bacterium]
MKPMTNSRARALGKKALRAAFKALKIKDGLGDEVINSDEFSFWYNKTRDGQVGNYLIYEVIDSEPTHRADDAVIGREFFAQVDVFSVRGFESSFLADFLSRLEEQLLNRGFEVEMRGEDYEPDTRLYHQILYVSKLFFA